MTAKKKKSKPTLVWVYFLLITISVCLIGILFFLPTRPGTASLQNANQPVATNQQAATGKEEKREPIVNKPSRRTAVENRQANSNPTENRPISSPSRGTTPKPPAPKPNLPVSVNTENPPPSEVIPTPPNPKGAFEKVKRGTILYIVLDDVGNDLIALSRFTSLPIKITYAVMPKRRFSEEAARRIHASGNEVIVHQPMEPLGSSDPGAGALFTWMSKDVIFKELQSCIATVPYAVGMNNHMGSKATENINVMSAVLEYLQEQNMFFLDSKTTAKVVGQTIALQNGWKYTQRNAMFLDNEKDRKSLEAAIQSGMKVAAKKGHAVMIGHVMTTELADVLLEMFPDILDAGYEFDHLSQYFTGEVSE